MSNTGNSFCKMALIGSIEHIDLSKTDIECYLERMDHLFKCNQVELAEKVDLFITLIGGEAYRLLKTCVKPESVASKTYVELKKILLSRLAPKRSVIVETYKFYKITQGEMSISEYIGKLKNQADICEFDTFLDRALRDKFVCGLSNKKIQDRLLGEKELSFQKACEIALAQEIVQAESQELQSNVNAIQAKQKLKYTKRNQFSNDKNKGNSNGVNIKPCYRCGRTHDVKTCPARNWECFSCKKKGHISKVCKSSVNFVDKTEESENESEDLYLNGIFETEQCTEESINVVKGDPVTRLVQVEGKEIMMEVDTGAKVTLISEDDFIRYFGNKLKMNECSKRLRTIAGNIELVGEVYVTVCANNDMFKLPLIVVKCNNSFLPLLGRSWLDHIQPQWRSGLYPYPESVSKSDVCCIQDVVQEMEKQYPFAFSQDLSQAIDGFTAKLIVKDDARFVFHKPYSLPYALREKVSQELKELESRGIIVSTTQAEIASPIVVVPKKDGKIRICVDFKKTLNPILRTDYYPLPDIHDIFQSLVGAKIFTVLDLSNAYLQLRVDQASQELLTINTHVGLYKFTRLPFGVSSAPALFQLTMEQALRGLKNVSVYIDDVIISGKNIEECKANVANVLQRLNKYRIRINVEKSIFFKQQVDFLGHTISGEGIKPQEKKVEAIWKAPSPTNVTELRAYLGLLNYYSRYIPMLSSEVHPLYELLNKNVKFMWTKEREKAFQHSKTLLLSSKALAIYDPSKPIIVTADSSNYGIGAVLSQIDNKEEKAVYFASCTLNKREQNYAQVHKEALALIFAVKKFHKFLYGKKFTLQTDHEPLRAIFGKKTGIPTLAHARLQRYAIILSAYDYEIKYRKGKEIANADGLSRLPLEEETEDEIIACTHDETLPLNADNIAADTRKDKLLQKVIELTRIGWPSRCTDEQLTPFFRRRNELSVEENILLWGRRIVIPDSNRPEVLTILHDQHPGMVRMKLLARSYVWWPNIDNDIERTVKLCEYCQIISPKPEARLTPWTTSNKNWKRIHIDFCKINNANLLILFDTTTKWIEVFIMNNSTDAQHTIAKLRQTFSCFGLPEIIVSDNGPPFNSKEFRRFCMSNGIQQVNSPPYHPPSNGSAERAVQTVKSSLKKLLLDTKRNKLTLEHNIQNFLFAYRNTPSAVTQKSPAEMMFRQLPRTKLSLLKPGHNQKKKKNLDEIANPKNRKLIVFSEGQNVLIYSAQEKQWKPGKVVKLVSNVTYLVWSENKIKFVHASNIKESLLEEPTIDEVHEKFPYALRENDNRIIFQDKTEVGSGLENYAHQRKEMEIERNVRDETKERENSQGETKVQNPVSLSPVPTPTISSLRRSSRIHKPPERLNL